jgi:hypothetical protein
MKERIRGRDKKGENGKKKRNGNDRTKRSTRADMNPGSEDV